MLRSDPIHRYLNIRPTEPLGEYAFHHSDQLLLMLGGDNEAVVHRQYRNVINRKVQHHLLSKKAVFVLKPQPSVKDICDWRV